MFGIIICESFSYLNVICIKAFQRFVLFLNACYKGSDKLLSEKNHTKEKKKKNAAKSEKGV